MPTCNVKCGFSFKWWNVNWMEVTEYLSTEVTSVRAKHRRNKMKKINTAVLVDVLLHLLHGFTGWLWYKMCALCMWNTVSSLASTCSPKCSQLALSLMSQFRETFWKLLNWNRLHYSEKLMATFKTDYVTRTKTYKGKVWLLLAQNMYTSAPGWFIRIRRLYNVQCVQYIWKRTRRRLLIFHNLDSAQCCTAFMRRLKS